MRIRFILAIFGLLLAGASADAQEVLYGANSDLFILDPATGAVITTVGNIGFFVTGLAVDPTTGILYGSTGREFGDGVLITIDKTTGAGTLVGDLRPLSSETAADLTFTSDGTLYGWLVGSAAAGDLVTINKLTGLATVVGDSGILGDGNGLAASSSDVLFYSGERDNGPLRTVNRTTGALSAGVTMNGTAQTPINAMAFNAAGTLYGSLRSGPLATINTATGALTVLSGSPNVDSIVFDQGQVVSGIPTLTEWMLLLLALTVAGIGFAMLRPR